MKMEGTKQESGDPCRWQSFEFSVDLVEKAREHLAFLESLHGLGVTFRKPAPRSLKRYRDQWLPLVARHADRKLVPPSDCAWLWHCHRLAPVRYAGYLRRVFGGSDRSVLLEANPPFAFQHRRGEGEEEGEGDESFSKPRSREDHASVSEETVALWNQAFPEEPFFLEDDRNNDDDGGSGSYEDLRWFAGFDLVSSAERQSTFLWQVSGPRFSDDAFLEDGREQYLRFLRLRPRAAQDGTVLVPTYQIDLMWHTHILSSLSGYSSDCRKVAGEPLNHDDSLNDRSEDGPLDRAFRRTQALWRERYGEEYHAVGGMYRGEPPEAFYCRSWSPHNAEHAGLAPKGVFLRFVGLRGASSTNPSTATGADTDSGVVVLWAWKESADRMAEHSPSEVVGDPFDCWIRYDETANALLQSAFESQGGKGACSLPTGGSVDFGTMEHTTATGSRGGVRRVESPIAWTPATGFAPDGSPGFVSMSARSTTRGVNANPMKPNYVFGKHAAGIGYYHVSTKEAYEILVKRIDRSLWEARVNLDMFSFCTLGLCHNMGPQAGLEREVERLEDLHTIARARARASAPTGIVGLATEARDPRQRRQRAYSDDSGLWYFPGMYYVAAGGCGAGTHGVGGGGDSGGDGGGGCGAGACGAGACGAGACGAGACGATACGGGGCGGGGCGGGGCGG